MFKKIKDFCKNKTVRKVAFTLFIVSAAVLIIGGIAEGDLNNVIKAVGIVIAAITGLISIIGLLINKEANNKLDA